MALVVKNLPANACKNDARTDGSIPGLEDPLKGRGIAIHSSILAWEMLRTKESSGLQSTGSQRVGHDWCDLACTHTLLVMRDRCLQSGFWCFSRHRVAKTGLIQSSPENIYLKACSSSFSWSTDCLVPDRHPALLSEAAEGQRLPRPVTAFLQNWMVSANFYSAIKIKWYRGKGWKWTVRLHLRLELCTEAVDPLLPKSVLERHSTSRSSNAESSTFQKTSPASLFWQRQNPSPKVWKEWS